MLKNLYENISQELHELYSLAALHEMTDDMELYKECTEKMIKVAEILGLSVSQFIVTYDIKKEYTEE